MLLSHKHGQQRASCKRCLFGPLRRPFRKTWRREVAMTRRGRPCAYDSMCTHGPVVLPDGNGCASAPSHLRTRICAHNSAAVDAHRADGSDLRGHLARSSKRCKCRALTGGAAPQSSLGHTSRVASLAPLLVSVARAPSRPLAAAITCRRQVSSALPRVSPFD